MKKIFNLVIAVMLTFNLASCGGGGSSSSSASSSCSSGSSAGSGSSSVTSLSYVDNVVGTGAVATDGSYLSVDYTGWLYNSGASNNEGTEFDATTAGSPFDFELGVGAVIPGWDQGLVGMKVGGTRTLTIPSSLAYGSCPAPGSPIPPDSALVFTVTLLGITS
jgi:FKBP-type peptidyl-prolyl cis-trans isomerase FkpA